MIRYYLGRKIGEVKVYRFKFNASETAKSSKLNTDNIQRSYFVFPDNADCVDLNCTNSSCKPGCQCDESGKCILCPGQEVTYVILCKHLLQ